MAAVTPLAPTVPYQPSSHLQPGLPGGRPSQHWLNGVTEGFETFTSLGVVVWGGKNPQSDDHFDSPNALAGPSPAWRRAAFSRHLEGTAGSPSKKTPMTARARPPGRCCPRSCGKSCPELWAAETPPPLPAP